MDDKTKAILLKVRKKATAPFNTVKKIASILTPLGWTFQAVKGLTKTSYAAPHNGLEYFYSPTLENIQARHALHARDLVPHLPSTPVVGQRYVVDLTPVEFLDRNHLYGYEAAVYEGVAGIRITSPKGEMKEFFPDRFDLMRNNKTLSIYPIWGWLWTTSLLSQVAQVLDTPEHVPAEERTRENTGTCPICFGNFKLANGHLVLHGFRRPGWGSTEGRCWAVGEQPLEVSVDAVQRYLDMLGREIQNKTDYLAQIERDRPRLFMETRKGHVWVETDDPKYPLAFNAKKQSVGDEIKFLKASAERYRKIVALWAGPYPLPGDPNWKYHNWDR
jgi:hypothetical protein